MSWKTIALDETTRKFLGELRNFRRMVGKTQREMAQALNVHRTTYQNYELGLRLPTLENLMRLAESFGYDLSESVNHKFFYGTLQPNDIKRELKRYDLPLSELSKQTGYSTDRLECAITLNLRSSLPCLSAVLEVLRYEREAEVFRRELLGKKSKSRRVTSPARKEYRDGKRI